MLLLRHLIVTYSIVVMLTHFGFECNHFDKIFYIRSNSHSDSLIKFPRHLPSLQILSTQANSSSRS